MWLWHRDAPSRAESEQEFTLAEVFPQFSTLVSSNRDRLVVDFDRDRVVRNVNEVKAFRGSNEEFADRFDITLKAGWNVTAAREKLGAVSDVGIHVEVIEYRPFDRRWIFFHPTLVWQTAPVISRNVHGNRPNRILISLGKNRADTINGQWMSQTLADKSVVSTRDNASGFPLYIHAREGELRTSEDTSRPNLSPKFLRHLSSSLGLAQIPPHGLPQTVTPEDIFNYAYAVLHSPSYRSRYAEYLKSDFPRVPLPGSQLLFRALCRLGDELVAVHLMQSPSLGSPITTYTGPTNPEVSKVGWSEDTVWIDAGKAANRTGSHKVRGTVGFCGVPERVWNFHIGGYRVCEKWLKDRKGRTLSMEDLAHYQKMVVALAETSRLTEQIDEVISQHGGWPNAFHPPDSDALTAQ
jgi:predicted helicase